LSLAIFDLDNTLLGGDSDHSWGEFLVEKEAVDREWYQATNDQFYEDYKAGQLNIAAYVAFTLEPLNTMTPAHRDILHREFMAMKIESMILPKAQALIEKHRTEGDNLLIITATNRFIAEPIARRLDIDNLLATEPEIVDGMYTGRISGTPCFRHGKVERLQGWIKEQNEELLGSFFYSDSFNDIPLLEHVCHPHAVDPDERLKQYAEHHNWPIISLR